MQDHDKKKQTDINLVGNQICHAGLFKVIKPYPDPKTKFNLLEMKRNKEMTDFKICLNWACGHQFKDIDKENNPKSCKHHPGKFDHGSTGIKMENYISELSKLPKERKSVIWEPHWTCCRKGWSEPGCKFSKHRGVFVEEFNEKKIRPYMWPDIRAKLYFTKIISDKWKKTIKQYTPSAAKVKKAITEGIKDGQSLVTICDNLNLYLLVVDEKADYHLKFNDVISSSNTVNYFTNKNGSFNAEKFIKWWNMNYDEIVNEMKVTEEKK